MTYDKSRVVVMSDHACNNKNIPAASDGLGASLAVGAAVADGASVIGTFKSLLGGEAGEVAVETGIGVSLELEDVHGASSGGNESRDGCRCACCCDSAVGTC